MNIIPSGETESIYSCSYQWRICNKTALNANVMNFFSLFSSKKHDDFAGDLASEFISSCPPAFVYSLRKRKDNNKFKKEITRLYKQAHDYYANNKLNIYTKARIGNKFMWSLKQAGYDDALIEELTNGILHALTGKKS
jgi:hypothetical protein